MTRLFSEIQFLEQNYDIVKCNIWMRQVAEIQNKVFEDKSVEGKNLTLLEFYITYFRGSHRFLKSIKLNLCYENTWLKNVYFPSVSCSAEQW